MAFVKTVNYEGGSDARYDVSQATEEERRQLDSEGRPLSADLPGQWDWTPGLPGARGGSGPGDLGGGGGAPGGGLDSYTRQLQSLLQSQAAAERAGTKSTIQQMLIGLGLVPQGFKDEMGALDDTTRALIEKNTASGISTWARLQEAAKDEERDTLTRLSAQGLRRSGAKGFKLRRGQLKKDRAQADLLAQFLGDVGNRYQGFAQNENSRQMQLLNALYSSQYSPSSSRYTPGPSPSFTPVSPSYSPVGTIGHGSTRSGYGTPFAPANVNQGGGFTSPFKPILMPED
jgi:hypothetical protein